MNKKTIWIMTTTLALLAGGVQAQERAIQDYAEHGDLHFKLKNANVECMGVWDEDDIRANAGTPQS